MNKQICSKLKIMLSGVLSNASDNLDYIKSVDFSFKSGLKEYKGNYDIEKKILNFNGKDNKINFIDIIEYIVEEAVNYDSFEFSLAERGVSTILYADNKNVKVKQEDKTKINLNENITTSQILKRNYFIKIGEADNLLKEIGILTKDGKIKNDMIRKYNQIDHFVELVDGMINEISSTDSITILDCGCGKSYLTFVLNYYIKEKKKKNCYFIGIDNSSTVIKASKDIAKKLGYKNMEFIEDDINFYKPTRKIDMVISLHACDIATDMALLLALRVNAKAIISVPCCHKELLSQYSFNEIEPIIKYGVFKSRIADILTDGMRALFLESKGYNVSIVEYISPLETPKNILIKAVKNADSNARAIDEYSKLKKLLNVNTFLEKYSNLYIE